MSRSVALVLVHHPVLDVAGNIMTTAVTNMDIHDLARSGRTYGCNEYILVHPIEAQRALVERIRTHWTEGSSGRRIPDRKEALGLVRVVSSLEELFASYGGRSQVVVWGTTARSGEAPLRFQEARRELTQEGPPILLFFGTGWGMAPHVLAEADAVLEPIEAERPGYNHLSVRSACAIVLDRLLGRHEQLSGT